MPNVKLGFFWNSSAHSFLTPAPAFRRQSMSNGGSKSVQRTVYATLLGGFLWLSACGGGASDNAPTSITTGGSAGAAGAASSPGASTPEPVRLCAVSSCDRTWPVIREMSWSPDGRKLAFVSGPVDARVGSPGGPPVATSDSNDEVWVANAELTQFAPLRVSSTRRKLRLRGWSADGGFLAVTSSGYQALPSRNLLSDRQTMHIVQTDGCKEDAVFSYGVKKEEEDATTGVVGWLPGNHRFLFEASYTFGNKGPFTFEVDAADPASLHDIRPKILSITQLGFPEINLSPSHSAVELYARGPAPPDGSGKKADIVAFVARTQPNAGFDSLKFVEVGRASGESLVYAAKSDFPDETTPEDLFLDWANGGAKVAFRNRERATVSVLTGPTGAEVKGVVPWSSAASVLDLTTGARKQLKDFVSWSLDDTTYVKAYQANGSFCLSMKTDVETSEPSAGFSNPCLPPVSPYDAVIEDVPSFPLVLNRRFAVKFTCEKSEGRPVYQISVYSLADGSVSETVLDYPGSYSSNQSPEDVCNGKTKAPYNLSESANGEKLLVFSEQIGALFEASSKKITKLTREKSYEWTGQLSPDGNYGFSQNVDSSRGPFLVATSTLEKQKLLVPFGINDSCGRGFQEQNPIYNYVNANRWSSDSRRWAWSGCGKAVVHDVTTKTSTFLNKAFACPKASP